MASLTAGDRIGLAALVLALSTSIVTILIGVMTYRRMHIRQSKNPELLLSQAFVQLLMIHVSIALPDNYPCLHLDDELIFTLALSRASIPHNRRRNGPQEWEEGLFAT
jgi:hypothetical protein